MLNLELDTNKLGFVIGELFTGSVKTSGSQNVVQESAGVREASDSEIYINMLQY